jgi:hypothetical protein
MSSGTTMGFSFLKAMAGKAGCFDQVQVFFFWMAPATQPAYISAACWILAGQLAF